LTTRWQLYSGTGSVVFSNGSQTNTTVTFSAPGVYTLMLSASNGIHATSFDAVVITVQDALRVAINRAGSNILLMWTGGRSPYTVMASPDLASGQWSSALTTNGTNATLPVSATARFFKVRSN
jgi:hypothetical protein